MILKKHYKIVYALIIIFSMVFASLTLVYIKDYIGYAGYKINATAGYIHQIHIHGIRRDTGWAGFYGFVIISPSNNQTHWPYEIDKNDYYKTYRYDLFFRIHASTGYDMYASTVNQSQLNVSISNLPVPASFSDINNFMGVNSTNEFSADNTFNDTMSVNFGGSTISNIPAIHTYPLNSSFKVGALKDSSGQLFFVVDTEDYETGFTGTLINYQMMLPLTVNKSALRGWSMQNNLTYYFFPDPISDPLFNDTITKKGLLKGYVTALNTGNPLDSVLIKVSGSYTSTNGSGYYSVLVYTGNHTVVATKTGYRQYIDDVVVSENGTWKNISMEPDFGGEQYNAEIFGYVFKNTSRCRLNFSLANCTVQNVTISAGGGSGLSNATGQYTFPLSNGTHQIIAVHTSYRTFISTVTVNRFESKEYNITLNSAYTGGEISDAYLEGYVHDRRDNSTVEDAMVAAGGGSDMTNSSGYYKFPVTASQNMAVMAIKSGFAAYLDYVNISPEDTLTHNITLYPLSGEDTPKDWGTVYGYVKENLSLSPIEDAYVIINETAKKTDPNGFYNISPDAGSNLDFAVFKYGYVPYFTNISVIGYTSQNINITLSRVYYPQQNGTVTGYVYEEGSTIPIVNATVIVGNYITYSDSDGNFSIDVPESGFYYIIGLKDGYLASVGNLTGNNSVRAGETVNHTIYMESIPTDQAYVAPSKTEDYTSTRREEQVAISKAEMEQPSPMDIFVSINEIIKKVKRGNYIDDSFSIYNFKDEAIRLTMQLEGKVSPSIQLEKEEIVIPPNTTQSIRFRILGNQEEGVYYGSVKIRGDYSYNIPVALTITEDIDIPVKTLLMRLSTLKKTAYIGYDLKYGLDLINLLVGRSYDVKLNFTISDINRTNITNIGTHELNIQTFSSLIRTFRINKDFVPGDYILSAKADYLGLESSTETFFTIAYPLHQYRVFGFLPLWILALIAGIILVGLATFLIIKHEMEKRKRFHAKVDYKEVPKEGPRSIFVGKIAETNRKAYFDMDV
ncbi:hypothetical protein GF323_04670, partial [Candidatus Woesearchaeota archaeon]|nr:hypothetical protein [Candidatus Woesearchaeota archaeon]